MSLVKKSLFILLFIAITVNSIFSTITDSKIYQTSSYEYRVVEVLCHSYGVAGPSTTGPISGAELKIALSRIDPKRLNSEQKALYEKVFDLLQGKDLIETDTTKIDFKLPISAEIYLQPGPDTASDENDWVIKQYEERKPIASARAEISISDNIYSVIDFNIQTYNSSMNWSDAFDTNLNFNISGNSPYEAAISIGNNFMSFILGRERMEYGNGYTGNLFIGDNFDYQEMVKLAFFTDIYQGSISLTHFDQTIDGDNPMRFQSPRFGGMHQTRIAVAQGGTLFDRATVTLMLGSMIQSDSAFDFRMFNPMMYFHNMWNYTEDTVFEANNFMSLDLVYTFMPGWTVSGQLIIDQIQTRGEVEAFEKLGILEPDAWGALVNVSYSDIIGNGLFNVYIEGVYTNPGLYLNEKYIDKEGNVYFKSKAPESAYPTWNQDLIVGYWRRSGQADVSYTGYKYGPDSAVISIGCTYVQIGFLDLAGHVSYIAHGEKGIGQDLTFDGLDDSDTYNKWSFEGECVEHTLEIAIEAEFKAYSGISVYGGFGFANKWNYDNNWGEVFTDFQLAVGISIEPFELFQSFCED